MEMTFNFQKEVAACHNLSISVVSVKPLHDLALVKVSQKVVDMMVKVELMFRRA